jgi:hypothetical protein
MGVNVFVLLSVSGLLCVFVRHPILYHTFLQKAIANTLIQHKYNTFTTNYLRCYLLPARPEAGALARIVASHQQAVPLVGVVGVGGVSLPEEH